MKIMKKWKFLILVLVLAVLFVGAYVLYDKLSENYDAPQLSSAEQQGQTSEEVSYTAPDFTVYDLEGNGVKLSDFFGKPIVLNFWASWCPPCRSEMPDFDEKARELTDVQFLMVNCTDGGRETVETASAYVLEQGFTFPVFYDTSMEAVMAYGASSLPMTLFIGADGNIVTYAVGAIDADTLQKGIDMIVE